MARQFCTSCQEAHRVDSVKHPDRYRRIPPCSGWAAPGIPCGYDDTGVIARAKEWDQRFLLQAQFISQWSKDPSTKAGSVIVDANKRVISQGFNGFPRGVTDTPERLNDRTKKYPMVMHAEQNAILFAKRDLEGCTIYVYPCPPCASKCAGPIIQSGIVRVVAPVPSPDYLSRWAQEYELAAEMFNETKTKVDLEMMP